MSHCIFFIHVSIQQHWSFFHVSWVTLPWTGPCRYLFDRVISSPLDVSPKVELLDHVVAFSFVEGPAYCFPYCLNWFTSPPTVQKGSLFSTYLPTLATTCLSDNNHSSVRWCLIVVKISISKWSVMLSTFPRTFGHLYIFFGNMSIQILCALIGSFIFSLFSCKCSLYT